jgi:hypothetical protein
MNFTNDLDIFLSTNQVKLITDVTHAVPTPEDFVDLSVIVHLKFGLP